MLIVIASDPRTSHRPAEAIRVAAGLAALEELPIEVCFCQAAALILHHPPTSFQDGDIIARHLPLIERYCPKIYAESGDPFFEGKAKLPYQRIGMNELTALANQHSQLLRF